MHILPKEVSKKKNDKVYIGITSRDPKVRWGKNGSNYERQLFGKAIEKYDWENFKHIILESNLSEEQAKAKEIELIERYKSFDREFGYNVSLGGDGTFPEYIVEERNKKISVANTGKKRTIEMKKRMSESKKGKKLPEETKKRISESNKGRILSQETIEKIRKANIGRTFSDESRKKMSEAQKGKRLSEETKEKIKITSTGRKHTEEAKRKISEARIGMKFSEETKKKISKALSSEKNLKRLEEIRKQRYKKVYCEETNTVYESMADAARKNNIDVSAVLRTCNGHKNRQGLHFMYYREE